MLLQLVIQIHYMQDIQQLALVLMQALDLYIEDRRLDRPRCRLYSLNVFRQTQFVLVLDLTELTAALSDRPPAASIFLISGRFVIQPSPM